MEEIGRELDSILRTYRSIPTTGQNSQIWYFPIQLKPVEDTEEKVNKRTHHWRQQRKHMAKMGGWGEKMYTHEDNSIIKTSHQVLAGQNDSKNWIRGGQQTSF